MTATRHPFACRDRLVFAHRGGAKLAPENTMAAFERGVSLGADGIECDVHLSRDGVPVVIHDHTLERTTDAVGEVSGRTADELARIDAGFRRRRSFGMPSRPSTPTFQSKTCGRSTRFAIPHWRLHD